MGIDRKYLDEFKYFGDRVYLDCSAMGMQPQRTIDAGKRYLDDFAGSLWQDPDIQGEVIRPKTRNEIAHLIDSEPEDIFFTRNTTEGNSLLARGFPLEKGDEVLICNEDFPSVYMPWTTRQQQGIRLTVVNGQRGIVSADAMIAAFSERTKIVCISMAQSSSGYVTDLMKLGKACHERGILLSVDAVQAAGRLPIDVEAMNIDLLTASSFKGLMGIMGAGFCWCRRDVMDKIIPDTVCDNIDMTRYDRPSGFTALPVPSFPSGASRMETGTTNNLGILMMGESIRMLNEIGIDNIAEQIRTVETRYRTCLERAGLPVQLLGADDPKNWSGSVSFLYDPKYKLRLSEALKDAGIIATVRRFFRIGIHFYNTEEDIDRLMQVLEKVFGQPPL